MLVMRMLFLLAALLVAPAARAAPVRMGQPARSVASPPVVPFIEDDFGRALALAKARKLPIFIEGWAPW